MRASSPVLAEVHGSPPHRHVADAFSPTRPTAVIEAWPVVGDDRAATRKIARPRRQRRADGNSAPPPRRARELSSGLRARDTRVDEDIYLWSRAAREQGGRRPTPGLTMLDEPARWRSWSRDGDARARSSWRWSRAAAWAKTESRAPLDPILPAVALGRTINVARQNRGRRGRVQGVRDAASGRPRPWDIAEVLTPRTKSAQRRSPPDRHSSSRGGRRQRPALRVGATRWPRPLPAGRCWYIPR